MRLKQKINDDSAVSPVIGVILMVAITVILAAVIASFVLGLGPSESAPQAQFDFEVSEGNNTPNVTISHQSGDTIDASTLSIQGDVPNNDSVPWTGTGYAEVISGGGSGDVTSGDSIELNTSSDDWELTLAWESGDQSAELASDSS